MNDFPLSGVPRLAAAPLIGAIVFPIMQLVGAVLASLAAALGLGVLIGLIARRLFR